MGPIRSRLGIGRRDAHRDQHSEPMGDPGRRGPAARHVAAVRPVGRNVWRIGLALAIAFAAIGAGAGYWQVIRSAEFSTAPDDPAVIAAARNTPRGRILDRTGTVLAQNKKDANGEPYRVYPDRAMTPVIGYESRLYGTAGLERTYDAQLTGVHGGSAVDDLLAKFRTDPNDPQDITLSISRQLQDAAFKELGSDRGAVVMLDPRTGEVLALASTPTFDASAIANPATAEAAWAKVNADKSQPLLARATQGQYVPGSILKIVTAIAGLGSGAISEQTTFPQQPAAEKTGLLVSGYRVRDGHHPVTGSLALSFPEAVEVSCNIYFALVGLRTGSADLTSWAQKLGFGQPIPFDLPTAVSQLTNGGGPLPGGFKDKVELANAAYGQAETLVTPLQMALVAATVANDGTLMRPHVVTALTSPKSGAHPIQPEIWTQVLSPEIDAIIKSAMQRAVEGDLGRAFTAGAAVPGIPTAGKTGTAQLGGSGEPHSWFIGFAPVDHPQVAIAVLVENGGHGAARAAPMAGRLMRLFFNTVGKQ